ncbi:MAG: hypothetical protein JWP63_702 [Candidatus Solibacter sp.]|nr:hypothetical protein [Candidatus Solibacter sp.]
MIRPLAIVLLTVLLTGMGAVAQPPKTGEINFYGLRKLTPDKVLGTVGLKPGDPLPPSKGDLEERLEEISGVVAARVEAVCCEDTSATLFIGLEERGSAHFDTRPAPVGTAVLPEELMTAYRDFMVTVARATQLGTAAEDLTSGESRLADPAVRALQEPLSRFAAEHLDTLRDVLRNGPEPEERAVAAAVAGFTPKKSDVINDLQFALQDPEPAVRANAVRALKAIAVLSQKHPELNLKLEPTWMVAMLNSLSLSDRTQAAETLVTLTERPNPAALDLIRERALPALVDMARWKTLRYALPSFLLLGRTAGVPDQELEQQWRAGDRETTIKKATSPAPAKPRSK